MGMYRFAIVAALEREVRPLLQDPAWHWKSFSRDYAGHAFRFFENAGCVVVCGGIGPEAARRAAEAVISLYAPEVIYSAGFAGALDTALQVAEIITPRYVVDAGDGSRVETESGEGILVSFSSIASAEQKARLRNSYDAQAVDMEAAAVARAATARGVRFAAVKTISDQSNVTLPAMDRFITSAGEFQSGKFALFVILRPWLWSATIRLARNSARASRALCGHLRRLIMNQKVSDPARTASAEAVTRQ
jgi:adenosylhomocysteine nucleosidase